MKKIFIFLLVAACLCSSQVFGAFPATSGTPQTPYCSVPPYIAQNVKPLIHLVLDYSGSMQFPVHIPCPDYSTNLYISNGLMQCIEKDWPLIIPDDKVIETRYVPTTDYEGYFDKNKYYDYKTAQDYFEINTACTNDDRVGKADSGNECISGNLLNWISTTRVDRLRQVLTGGRLYSKCKDDPTKVCSVDKDCEGKGDICLTPYTDVIQTEGAIYQIYDSKTQCTFKVTSPDNSTTGRQLKIKEALDFHRCDLGVDRGTGSIQYNLRVKHSEPELKGLVQSIYPGNVDLVLSTYNLKVDYPTVKNDTLQNFVTAINVKRPDGGTSTGEALTFAQKYFEQEPIQIKQCRGVGAFGQDNTRILCNNDNDCPLYWEKWHGIPYWHNGVCDLTQELPSKMIGKGDANIDPYYTVVDGKTIDIPCKKNFVMLVSDGEYNGNIDPVKPAYDMNAAAHHPPADLRTDVADTQSVSTYILYAFGTDTSGQNSMKTTAMFGGFTDRDSTGFPYSFNALPSNSSSSSYPRTGCNPSGTWNQLCYEWDKNRTGLPYNYFGPEIDLNEQMQKAFSGMISSISSGTAASVGTPGGNDGSLIMQGMFMPEKVIGNSKLTWIGEIQGLWMYADPRLQYSGINFREDTDEDWRLNLKKDYIVEFTTENMTAEALRYVDNNGDGAKDSTTQTDTIPMDNLKALFKAGYKLWSTKPASRIVYTNVPSPGSGIVFNNASSNRDLIRPYLDVAGNDSHATNVIDYTLGYDYSGCSAQLPAAESKAGLVGYRCRTATMMAADGKNETHVWKLGDIINSTPKSLTDVKLNSYGDAQPNGYYDLTYQQYLKSDNYKNRGHLFVGSNDGMMHVFKQGKTFTGPSGYVATLAEPTATNNKNAIGKDTVGKEEWAFIPYNALPYIKHLGNPEYRHLFYVDATPVLFDASIGLNSSCKGPGCERTSSSWSTVLIGGMGQGGATKTNGTTCPECYKTCSNDSSKICSDDSGCSSPGKCTVSQTCCVISPVANTGYSSFFFADVTNPIAPSLIGEFATPLLGFSTVTPTIVRQNFRACKSDATKACTNNSECGAGGCITNTNGKWYAILASGPTGPIDTVTMNMKGYSDQPLRIFVLDLFSKEVWSFSNEASDTEIKASIKAPWTFKKHIQQTTMPSSAFGGSFSGATIDTDKWDITRTGAYADDAVYLGYTEKDTTNGSASKNRFSKGGVLRMLTGDSYNPEDWKISHLIKDIGPVTSSVTKLQDTFSREMWLFFGTGRYFHKSGVTVDEDYTGQTEAIYGIKEPCYVSVDNDLSNTTCTTTVATGSNIQNQTTPTAFDTSKDGWKINLATASGSFAAQRIITNPVASSTGVLLFSSFYPYSSYCEVGGKTSYWQIKFNSGAAPGKPLTGAIVHQSSKSSATIDFKTAFTESADRETIKLDGVPSKESPLSVSNANHIPSKKILHIREH